MTRQIVAIVSLSLLAALSGGCYGFGVSTNITPLNSGSFSAHSRPVKVLFGASAGAPHQQLAYIEVVGTRGMSTSELMAKMEQKAQDLGADAVVSASHDYKNREAGNVLLDVLSLVGCVATKGPCHVHNNHYTAPVLRGVAVKYVNRPRRMVARRTRRVVRKAAPRRSPAPPPAMPARPQQPVVALGRIASMSAVPGKEVAASLTGHLERRLRARGVAVTRTGQQKPDRTIAASSTEEGGLELEGWVKGEHGQYHVTASVDHTGHLAQGACTCRWIQTHGLGRGPCKHLLALRHRAESEHGDGGGR